jgi:hypothetical protein
LDQSTHHYSYAAANLHLGFPFLTASTQGEPSIYRVPHKVINM